MLTPHPTCTPQLFGHRTRETEDGRQPLKRVKFYILYTGGGAGMYRDWGEVSARTNKVSGALHRSFHSWEEAVEAWKQYCLSHHDHPADMQDGTVYNPVQSTPPPRSVSPPHNNVRAPSIARQHIYNLFFTMIYGNLSATPTCVASTSTRHVAESPSHDIFSYARSRHGSPSKKRVATAFYGPESPPRQPVSSPRPPLWAVSVESGQNGVFTPKQKLIITFNREEVDEIMREAARRGLTTQQREVDSVVEASEWFSRLDLTIESSSIADDLE
ncbi:hypothetical protein D9758_011384 [Tetrapyrgos nigripes]|uniref:Ribonuclease H1 N-terminal domain-containing protein n=1 Tax=Tetrapyrgos nigripes TaxID=182062 RepID=A0A8H5G8E3_9AGAR|nr:hypothetical protein D9758_011384 [Tetrapyrgos nigripes]